MQCWVTGNMLGCHTRDGKGEQIFGVMGVCVVKQQTSLGGYVCGSAGAIGSTQGVRR